jgi:hypothetical protein
MTVFKQKAVQHSISEKKTTQKHTKIHLVRKIFQTEKSIFVELMIQSDIANNMIVQSTIRIRKVC